MAHARMCAHMHTHTFKKKKSARAWCYRQLIPAFEGERQVDLDESRPSRTKGGRKDRRGEEVEREKGKKKRK